MDRFFAQWRGVLWILFMIGLLLIMGGVLGDFRPGTQSVQLEGYSASETYSGEFEMTAGQVSGVAIQGSVGDVTIQAGEATDLIRIAFTKTAYGTSEQDAEEELDDVFITSEQEDNWLRINTVQRSTNTLQRSNRVDLVVTVPPDVQLDIFVATGDVRVEGVRVVGEFKARVVTGDLIIDGVDVAAGMSVQTGAGSVTFAGALGAVGDYALTASLGTLTVRLPADTDAVIEAQATLGAITVDGLSLVDLTTETLGGGANLRGTLGAGGPVLALENKMGDIRLLAE